MRMLVLRHGKPGAKGKARCQQDQSLHERTSRFAWLDWKGRERLAKNCCELTAANFANERESSQVHLSN
jgi:hypothetical protein